MAVLKKIALTAYLQLSKHLHLFSQQHSAIGNG